ncbi:hypothetical protein QFC21_001347 [Naganishia friedmannii]|uniref:Uncharacterized protein n=1 Tax=Naganishia friedmannii TaxID=89922 RepID=A0ACC2W469_9TREE|nr:hypothetical protein QFC21_001347 [Naganishia friedmannii]
MAPPTSNERSTPHPAIQSFVQHQPAPRHVRTTSQQSRPSQSNNQPHQVQVQPNPSQPPSSKKSSLPVSQPRFFPLDTLSIRPPPSVPPPSVSPVTTTAASNSGVQMYEPLNLFTDVFPRMRQMIDSYEATCRPVITPGQESIWKLNGIIHNQISIIQMQDKYIRSRDKHLQQVETLHFNQTAELKKRLLITENDLSLEKSIMSQLRQQKNEMELLRRKDFAELQKVQAKRNDLLFEMDKMKREHVIALGTLQLMHKAELKRERDQRKKLEKETESTSVSPAQASIISELEVKVRTQAEVIRNLELEKRTSKEHPGRHDLGKQTNELGHTIKSMSPDPTSVIRDLEAKIGVQAQIVERLEQEKRSLKEEYERLDSEGEIVGFAGRGGDADAEIKPPPRRRAGRPKGSKNRVPSASLPSPIISSTLLPEESDISQGLSGRQVLQLKRKLKNNVITKAQAKDEAMRLRSGGETIISPASLDNPLISSAATISTDERASSKSSLLVHDINPALQVNASSSLSSDVSAEVYATESIRTEVAVPEELEDQSEEQAVESRDWRRPEKDKTRVNVDKGETQTEHANLESQSQDRRSIPGHHDSAVDARTEITIDSDQQNKSPAQDCGRLSALAELASNGMEMKKDITLENIQELLVALAPLQPSLPSIPSPSPSDVRVSRNPTNRISDPTRIFFSDMSDSELSMSPPSHSSRTFHAFSPSPPTAANMASTDAPATDSPRTRNATHPAPSVLQPNDRKRKGNNTYSPAGKIARTTGPGF